LAALRERGWAGPFPLLSPADGDRLVETALATQNRFTYDIRVTMPADAFETRPWLKSMHAFVPAFMEIATNPAIVNRAVALLGPDVVVWGLTIIRRSVREKHRWHVDVEHRHWPGISAWIGLQGTALGSGLKFIDGSHRFRDAPQDHGVASDEEACALARRCDPAARLSEPSVRDGEFLLFDGTTWHGSENVTDRVRTAMLIQYSRPDSRIAIPLNADGPIVWHPHRPPCIVVAGRRSHC
jgi:hypothetical protein